MRQRLPKHLINTRAVVALLLSAVLYPLPAAAVSNSSYAAFPSGQQASSTPWFRYHLAPGQAASGSVTIVNKSSTSADFLVYPVDAVLGNQNAFTMLPASSLRQDAGAWLALDNSQVTVPAQAERQVNFHFNVPAGAAVGQHYGGIIVQPPASAGSGTTGANLTIISRLGVRVYETVPGKQHPGLTISNFSHQQHGKQLSVTATLHNDGNTVLTPQGQLQVSDTFGKLISTTSIGGDILEAGTTSKLQTSVTLPRNVPGHLTASLSLNYANNKIVARHVGFWSDGHWLALFGLIDILVIGGFWRAFNRKPRNLKS